MAGFDNTMFTSPESMQPILWDSTLDQQLIASYNQIMNQASDFYSSFDSPAAGSPVSDDSSTRSHSRRTSKNMTELKGAVPDKVERRREQNRQSQRAYRDRKEKHQRDLEAQIAAWKEKHEKLVTSYTAQTEEVSQLKAQVDELNSKIMALQSGMTPELWTSTPHDFDLVPFNDSQA